MRHHCIISGTGRAGTTAIVRLLTRLGLETGFDLENMYIDEIANAGLERDLRDENCPYIVKAPWIGAFIREVIDREDLIIDSAIIPIREITLAAESRRVVQRKHGHMNFAPGGLWNVDKPEDQECKLAIEFFDLIFHLSRKAVPIIFVHFPRFVVDPEYLHEKLSQALTIPDRDKFDDAFFKEMKPELVHLKG
jgi:hypothetical protein